MSESKSIDEKKLNSFMDKIFNDLSGRYTTLSYRREIRFV